jgi:hypothetical protein
MATAIVTIRDACPAFSAKIFKLSDELTSVAAGMTFPIGFVFGLKH